MKRIFLIALFLFGCENIEEKKSRYDLAFDVLMINEGGYSNCSDDPGGETKYGICKTFNPDIDVKNITLDFAKNYYREGFWSPIYDKIDSTKIAIKLFDTTVHVGKNGIRTVINDTLMESLRSQDPKLTRQFKSVIDSYEKNPVLWEDYVVNQINSMKPTLFLNLFKIKLGNYYCNRVRQNKKLSRYIKGWLSRALR